MPNGIRPVNNESADDFYTASESAWNFIPVQFQSEKGTLI